MEERDDSKAIARYADTAMFAAEPMEGSEEFGVTPKVYLIWMTPDPLGAIAAACKMYKGEVVRSLADVTHEERHSYLEQVQRTKLKAPFEFVKFHFMVEGVSRSLTHQMVRQRTAVYAQESLRFAVKEDLETAMVLPPSIAGLKEDDPKRTTWDLAVMDLHDQYMKLINAGIPAEDARGLMPHNVATRLHYATDLRALQDHAGNRLCTQAQFEWRLLWTEFVRAIREYRPHAAMLKSVGDNATVAEREFLVYMDSNDGWQFEALADMFRPVCYLTGKCEFMAEFDRHCDIRERVTANHQNGRPSSEWGKDWGTHADGPIIPKIRPEEWLLNPAAARQAPGAS